MSRAKRLRELLAVVREQCLAVGGCFTVRRRNNAHVLLDVWGPDGAGVVCFTTSQVDPCADRNFTSDVRKTLRNGKTRAGR